MKKIVRFLGSLGMAVALLVTIAVILAWGTFYEAQYGTDSAQRFVYHSWWFQGILFFLGVNLAVAAFERYPWKKKHIPFLCAHVGIILILIGGILGARYGIEGQLHIPEGESEHFLQVPRTILIVHPMNPGGVFVFPTLFETQPTNHAPNVSFKVPAQGKFLTVTADRYFPNADIEEEIVPTGSEENPAVQLALSLKESSTDGARQESVWLFSRNPNRFGVISGQIHILFLEAKTKEELKKWLRLPLNGLCLVRDPSGRLLAVFSSPNAGNRKWIPVKIGKRYRHPRLNLEFSVAKFFPRAEIKRHFVPQGDDVRQEALHFRLRKDNKESETWLLKGFPESVLVGDEKVILEYRKEALELPVSIKLLDFRKEEYPGTNIPSHFESDVELTDSERGIILKKTIRMNSPLKYRGYSFFQSSYVDGPKQTTILSVRNDPGTPFVYAGCLIVVAGVVGMFLLKREK